MTSDQAPSSLANPDAPRVSIVIPAYNAVETIADTLDSVCAQTWPFWEAIVVDDGSTDRTGALAREFAERDPRIRVITQANGGEAAARNAGLACARYDWLLFLDADDWIAPRHLQRMTEELASDPTLDAVHCASTRVAPDGTHVDETYSPPTGDLFPILARRAAFNVHACVVRKRVVDAVGGFDTSLQRLPDWDLWQRVARTGARFGAVREILAFYRMRRNSVSLDAHQILRDGLRILKQGHSPDARVPKPDPVHVSGQPPDGIRTEAFYFLSWCAGLVLGSGGDARPLLEMLTDETYPDLYPPAIAECLFRAAPLSTSSPPHRWEDLWFEIGSQVETFLDALERHSLAPNLARRALVELKTMILSHSSTWRPVLEELERGAASRQARLDQLERDHASLLMARDEQQRSAAATRERNASLERQLRELQQRLDEVQRRCTGLDAELGESIGHGDRMQRALSSTQTELRQSQESSAALAQQVASLEQALSQSRQQSADLARHLSSLEQELAGSRQQSDALAQDKSRLARELAQSRRIADERGQLLDDLERRRWIRFGRRARLLKGAAYRSRPADSQP